jgi:hypothetical protein
MYVAERRKGRRKGTLTDNAFANHPPHRARDSGEHMSNDNRIWKRLECRQRLAQGICEEFGNDYWKGTAMLARVTAEQGRRYMRAAGRVLTCTLKRVLLVR